jgi:hypothetical protein
VGTRTLTLSMDEQLLARAGTKANALGTSLNQRIPDYLEHLVPGPPRSTVMLASGVLQEPRSIERLPER